MLMISLNRKALAPTQLQGLPFNSMVTFKGRALGAAADGIHAFNECNDEEVDAFIETPLSDWGSSNQKRVRRVYLSGEFAGSSMVVKTKNREGNERQYLAMSSRAGEDSIFANVGRDGKGRHWSFRIENIDGADFSIDTISVIPIILNRRR